MELTLQEFAVNQNLIFAGLSYMNFAKRVDTYFRRFYSKCCFSVDDLKNKIK